MQPAAIGAIVKEIASLTSSPFAVNLWVSTADAGSAAVTQADYEAALRPLKPFYDELGVAPPALPFSAAPTFDQQVEALIEARPPVFSFIFGVPSPAVFDACRARGIVMMGTATSVDEAVALANAGVDVVVASGFEAGGHRASFLRGADASLMGTFALVPQVADAVGVPVVAAGGVADGRGVAAALTLGAAGVQVGTAFLACDESNAPDAHKAALLNARSTPTMLTRAFTGRLARGLTNRLGETVHASGGPWLPYPLQGELVRGLRAQALRQGRTDLIAMWAGQAAPLVRRRHATEVFADLVSGAARLLDARG
jgi:nitronate monooxygenase